MEVELSSSEENYTDVDSAGENVCLNHTTLESFQTCIREQALAQLRYMSSTQADIFTFIYACISIMGALGNGLVIFVVVRHPEMRTTRNVFIVNLALSNFLLALILVPFLWLPTYRIEFPYGAFMCKLAQAFPSTNIFCSTLTVSAIAVDRYFAVVHVRIGPGVMKTVQATLLAVAIWILSFSLSILYLLHFDIKDYLLPSVYVPEHIPIDSDADQHILLFQRCQLQPQSCLDLDELEDEKACYKYYETAVSGIMAIFIYCVPMPILVVFSCLLTRFLANNERQQSALRHRVSKAVLTSPAPPQSLAKDESAGTSLQASSGAGNGKHCSSAQSRGSRKRSRTTALLFAMAFSNALLWLPFTVVSLFIQLGPSDVTKPFDYELRQLDDAFKLISMLSICVNPFLYGYLNTNFQREFKRIFQNCCPWWEKRKTTKNAVLLVPTTSHGQDGENSVTLYVNGEHAVRGWLA